MFALLALWLLLTAGCTSDGNHEDTGSPKSLLCIGTPMKIRQANPLADYSYSILSMLTTHETLVRFNADMEPVPQLAASWSASKDAARWTFHLVDNALWHDGRPVTPEDVTFTFTYMGATHPASAWIRDLIAEIKTEGHTITFFLNRPYSRFLINVGFIVRILPRHIWQPENGDVEPRLPSMAAGDRENKIPAKESGGFRVNPLKPGNIDTAMGCGPYILDGFDEREKRIRFRRNDAYYGPRPAAERLEFRTHLTMDTLTLHLIRGDVDMFYKYASGFQPTYLPRLEKTKTVTILHADGLGIPAALGFNLSKGPCATPSFRRALAWGFDYKKLSRSLLSDFGSVPTAGFSPAALKQGNGKMPPLQFSPDQSRGKLRAMGCRDTDNDGMINDPSTGKNIVLRLLTRSDLEGMDALLPILSYNLRQIGIGLEIEKADLSTWILRVRQQQHDLVLFRTTPWGMLMEAGCGTGYFDSRRSGGGTLSNVTDPRFHQMCDQILETTDPQVQSAIYSKIRHYYADHLPALALCWSVNAYPFAGRLETPVINPIEGGIVNRETLCRKGN